MVRHNGAKKGAHPPFSGSIVALVTPFTPKGGWDRVSATRLLEWHRDAGTDGVLIGGTTGESPTLTPKELRDYLSLARSIFPRSLLACIGGNDTQKSLELLRYLEASDCDGYLLTTPFYNKPPQEGLIVHFSRLAEATSRPVILYNVPGRCGVDLLPSTIKKLAAIPNVIGVKEASGDVTRLNELRSLPGFLFFSGEDALTFYLMAGGATGVISVTSNVAPRSMKKLCDLLRAEKIATARSLNDRLHPIHRDLFLAANPIPVKMVLASLKLIGPNFREPLVPLPHLEEKLQPTRERLIELGEVD